MIWGKNNPVNVYEAGKPIEQQPTPLSRFTRRELTDFMRDQNIIFSPKDIKKGAVQLSPEALRALNQSGLRSVLEPKHVMSEKELQTYGRHRAANSVKIKLVAIKPAHAEIKPKHTSVANSEPVQPYTRVVSAIDRYLSNRKQAKEQAELEAVLKDEADQASFFNSYAEKTQLDPNYYRYRKLGVVVSGVCISIFAVGPVNAAKERLYNTPGSSDISQIGQNMLAPYIEFGNSLEHSRLNILKK